MILKSDVSSLKHEAPKRLPGELPVEAPGPKPHVSLLEFLSVDVPRRNKSTSNSGSGLGERSPETPPATPPENKAAQEEERAQERAVQTRAMVEAARAEARLAARREMTLEMEDRIDAERARIATVCAEFMRDRHRYFADAEEQVVKLALAIAARVLHREAMMDPLLLAGAVRVAIAKVEESSAVSLRVDPAAAEMWRGVFSEDLEPAVEVIGDDRLTAGEIVLETVVGRVELGVAVQLEEIEQGFFDLLQRRPN